MSRATPSKPLILLGVAIAIIGNALFAFSQLEPDASIPARLLREGTAWLLLAVVVGYALRIEKLPATSLGLCPFSWKQTQLPGLAAGIALTLFAGAAVYIAQTVFHLEADNHLISMLAGMPWWMLVLLSLRAGFVEEILFRGYLLDRLTRLSGRRWIGIVGSIALFTAMHFGGWQAGQLILVALAGTLFTALYLWKRNIMICVIAHFTVDLIAALAITANAQS
ncbi:MAG: lysostaphin resistance A-like protein [Sphingorhabdus sp.]|uniref:CPBP family intramembrane glutamic endopeptidase n=1 Tax=Sphingorhabdus sp. TaxID=1902408 RepID=UPI0038FC8A35